MQEQDLFFPSSPVFVSHLLLGSDGKICKSGKPLGRGENTLKHQLNIFIFAFASKRKKQKEKKEPPSSCLFSEKRT